MSLDQRAEQLADQFFAMYEETGIEKVTILAIIKESRTTDQIIEGIQRAISLPKNGWKEARSSTTVNQAPRSKPPAGGSRQPRATEGRYRHYGKSQLTDVKPKSKPQRPFVPSSKRSWNELTLEENHHIVQSSPEPTQPSSEPIQPSPESIQSPIEEEYFRPEQISSPIQIQIEPPPQISSPIQVPLPRSPSPPPLVPSSPPPLVTLSPPPSVPPSTPPPPTSPPSPPPSTLPLPTSPPPPTSPPAPTSPSPPPAPPRAPSPPPPIFEPAETILYVPRRLDDVRLQVSRFGTFRGPIRKLEVKPILKRPVKVCGLRAFEFINEPAPPPALPPSPMKEEPPLPPRLNEPTLASPQQGYGYPVPPPPYGYSHFYYPPFLSSYPQVEGSEASFGPGFGPPMRPPTTENSRGPPMVGPQSFGFSLGGAYGGFGQPPRSSPQQRIPGQAFS